MTNNADRIEDPEVPPAGRRRIAHLVAENQRLREELGDGRFACELRDVFSLAATAGTLAAPIAHKRLLELIVQTAAHVISGRAAALFMVDQEAGELVLEVGLGPKAAAVKQLRLPIGHGVAGLVAASAQPMAVSDAQRDPQHAADIAAQVGYLPTSILCVPLCYEGQVIGVLELLDKIGAPTFGLADIETLGLFAEQAAVAIEQSRTLRSLAALIGEVLHLLGESADPRTERLRQEARAFARRIEEEPAYQQALALAQLIQELGRDGPDGLAACQTILRTFVAYTRSRTGPAASLGTIGGELGSAR